MPSGARITAHFSGLTRQVHAAADARRDLRAAAHHLGRLRRIVGDRHHVDAERGQAGDGEADHHVVVDAQHVGAQARIHRDGLAGGGRGVRRHRYIPIPVRHRRTPMVVELLPLSAAFVARGLAAIMVAQGLSQA
jgi:hypothetical protein